MPTIQYVGDPKDGGSGPAEVSFYGQVIPRSHGVNVKAGSLALVKARGNPHFLVQEDSGEGAELSEELTADVIAELKGEQVIEAAEKLGFDHSTYNRSPQGIKKLRTALIKFLSEAEGG